MSIIRARLREISLDTGKFSKSHKFHNFGNHWLACGEFSTVLPCSQLPLSLVGKTACREDGHRGDSIAPQQQHLYDLSVLHLDWEPAPNETQLCRFLQGSWAGERTIYTMNYKKKKKKFFLFLSTGTDFILILIYFYCCCHQHSLLM